MRFAFVILILLSSVFCYGQRKNSPGKNLVGLESGMFHRGLIGVSYHRMNENRDRFLAGFGGGAGIGGVPFGGRVNQFYFATGFTGFGFMIERERLYVTAGTDLRYTDYNAGELDAENNYYRKHYSGFGLMPYFALTCEQKSILFQMRVSPWAISLGSELPSDQGGVGITVGKLF